MKLCPCCSNLEYEACCKPYHEGVPAPTPLSLMRSRYAAYALQLSDYIIQTTHPQNPLYEKDKTHWENTIHSFSKKSQFIKLNILAQGDDWVEFVAYIKQENRLVVLKEKSLFSKLNGKWLYLSGEFSFEC